MLLLALAPLLLVLVRWGWGSLLKLKGPDVAGRPLWSRHAPLVRGDGGGAAVDAGRDGVYGGACGQERYGLGRSAVVGQAYGI